jgi:hypothetical protein
LILLLPGVAQSANQKVDVHAYVNDSCILADEPYFLPAPEGSAADQQRPKFLPLIGIVVGKLIELYINREVGGAAKQMKQRADRKDTSFATSNEINLYRADLAAMPVLRINANVGCMTIVAARLKSGTDCTATYLPKKIDPATMQLPQDQWKALRTDDSIENQLRRANICVDGDARAVYETRFEFSKDASAYRLKDAGYRINSLLTTDDKKASRSVLYALKITQPAATEQPEILSSTGVKLGTVAAGSRSNGSADFASPWMKVPTPSPESRRVFDEKTGTRQQLAGEINALKRLILRNQRMIDGMDQRIANASPDLLEGLKQERTKTAVQIQVQQAELDARNSEFEDLPSESLEFMPVQIEVAVTETESEKKSQLAWAEIVGDNSAMLASVVGGQVTTMVSRSMKRPEEESPLERARSAYFDALVDVRVNSSAATGAELQHRLQSARLRYNEERRTAGLDPIR